MPIIIKKGSDVEKNKKKNKSKLLRKSDSQDSVESKVDFSKIATDMTDVIDFKVYRVIKPNFYNNTTRINLIGEQFYQEDDDVNAPTGTEATLVESAQPANIPENKSTNLKQTSHFNDLDALKDKLKQLNFADILTRVKNQKKQVDAIKSGKTIQSLLKEPSLEETITWAIKYVSVNDEALVLHIVNLYYDLKSFDKNLESLAKNYKADRVRGYSEDVPNRSRTASDQSMHSNHNSRSRTHSTDVSPPRRKSSYLHSGSSSPRRNSSRLLSGTTITDPLLSAASDKLRATQQQHTKYRTKNLTLLQQLEHIKAQGTETFLRAIAPPKESTIPFSRKNWKQSYHNTTTGTSSTSSLGAFARRVSISNAVVKKMAATAPGNSTEGVQTNNNNNNSSNSSSQHRAVPPSSPRPSSSSSNSSHVNPHRGAQHRQQQQPPPSHTQLEQPHSQDPPSAAPCSPRPAELLTSLHSTSKTARASKSMNPAQAALTALLHSTAALQTTLSSKITRAQHCSRRLRQSHQHFHKQTQQLQTHTACLFEEKEFNKPIHLFYQLQEFQNKTENFHTEHELYRNLKIIRETATVESHSLYRERLYEQRWFLAILIKIHEYMKKRNNNVPICCLRLIIALEQIIIIGYAITTNLFYRILEETVIVKEDHTQTILHTILKIIREVLNITAEEFLHYLEKKEIPAHPELVQTVRAMNKLASKKHATVTTTVTSSSSVLRSSIILSTDASKNSSTAATASKVTFEPDVSSLARVGGVPEVSGRSSGERRSRGSVIALPEAGTEDA